jgi:hypothetical protein
MKISLNGVPNVHDRFVAGFALGNAARQDGAFGHKNTIFIRFDQNTELHDLDLMADGAHRVRTLGIEKSGVVAVH